MNKNDVFKIFDIEDLKDLPNAIMALLEGDLDTRNNVYKELIRLNNYDMSYDWFQEMYESELSERKQKGQDFTSPEVSGILSDIVGQKGKTIHEPTAGCGGLIIVDWWKRCKKKMIWEHFPSENMVTCWELSARSIPILLLNLSIRGIMGYVYHGDVLERTVKMKYDYNKIYDIMNMAGVPLSKMRLCQPYGDDQRQGLYLFKILEPETWAKVVNRVEGANFGNRYTENDKTTLGNYKVNLPGGHTYESYAKFLLSTMPPYLAEHYTIKIKKFLSWWEKEGIAQIPDFADMKQESAKKIPSWRRICKVLLKNDYWCKGLSFAQTKRELEKQIEMITRYGKEL